MKRHATANWQGTGKEGKGTLTSQSTVLNKTQYNYGSRFAEGVGTNPEELIASAHAGCFTMKLSFLLNKAGFTADNIDTKCEITFDTDKGAITNSHLTVSAKIPNIDKVKFDELVKEAKDTCPISKSINPSIQVSANATLV